MNIFYNITASFFYLLFKLCYKHKSYGRSHFIPGAAIIAPNHASFWDPPIIGGSAPEETYFLARSTLFDNRLLKLLITHLNSYPVQGNAQDLHSFKIICALLKEKKKVVIFPEGNRTFDGKLGPIKSGVAMLAFRCNCPIIPTYIAGTFEVWPRQRKYPKLSGKTACVFGSPLYPETFQHLSKKEAQEALSATLLSRLKELEAWYFTGAEGVPP
jgi:1-acyl-sn-glycerol-3-phosphate acyltransferase